MRRAVLTAAIGMAALVPTVASAFPTVQVDYVAKGVSLYAESQQRGLDQTTNPIYLSQVAPYLPEYVPYAAGVSGMDPARAAEYFTDPYRHMWAKDRGTITAVSWRNRYGAKIAGHVLVPAKAGNKKLPTVIFIPGFGDNDTEYLGVTQTIAEAGYVVLSFDPQGQGLSDFEPAKQFCKPGAWQKPQEGGIRELGTCAGVVPPLPFEDPLPGSPTTLPSLAGLAAYQVESYIGLQPASDAPAFYPYFRPNFVFGALDALKWLESSANPARRNVDFDKLGIIGHSAGSDGAFITPGVDPKHRFKASVSLDDYGLPPAKWKASSAALIIQTELQGSLGPYTAPTTPDYWPSIQLFNANVAGGQPTARISLAGTDHTDFGYLPERGLDPTWIGVNASRYGERLGAYYATAWFDRFLKGDRSGTTRMLAKTYDGSVDKASTGLGHWNPLTQANEPYLIKGLKAKDKLSPFVTSPISFDGHVCTDLLTERC